MNENKLNKDEISCLQLLKNLEKNETRKQTKKKYKKEKKNENCKIRRENSNNSIDLKKKMKKKQKRMLISKNFFERYICVYKQK